MAYRRKPGLSRSSTFKEDMIRRHDQDDTTTTSSSERCLDAFRSSSDAFQSSFNNRSKISFFQNFCICGKLFLTKSLLVKVIN